MVRRRRTLHPLPVRAPSHINAGPAPGSVHIIQFVLMEKLRRHDFDASAPNTHSTQQRLPSLQALVEQPWWGLQDRAVGEEVTDSGAASYPDATMVR
jgi:hypothetical protein